MIRSSYISVLITISWCSHPRDFSIRKFNTSWRPSPPILGGIDLHFKSFADPLIMYTKFGLVCSKGLDFHFLTLPHILEGLFLHFLFSGGPKIYVYKIWLSLIQGPIFSFFDPLLNFGRYFLHFYSSGGPLNMYTKFGWVWSSMRSIKT